MKNIPLKYKIVIAVIFSIIAISVRYYRHNYINTNHSRANVNYYAANYYSELVYDTENLFSKEQKDWLNYYHSALLQRYDIDLRIVTGQASPEQAVAFFKQNKIGEKSKTRKGILLAIDSKTDQVRLEISAGLDAVYTDGFVAYIQQKQMVPFFQANQVASGILATTEMLVTRAQEAIAGKAFIPPEQLPQNLAIGAGAQTAASIGTGYIAPQASNSAIKTPDGASPEDVVALYHKALAEGNTAYDLPIYSAATQKLRQSWVVTPAQMKNELTAYKNCKIDKAIILKNGKQAVVRYRIDDRQCSPYFLVMEDGAWRLDFATMMKHIRFGISNSWHFDMKQEIPFAEAFADWKLNHNGYPFPLPKMRWGINIRTVSDQQGKLITYVEKIYPDTAATSMDLQENDVILSWDGMENPFHKQVADSMGSLEEGTVIKVKVWRNGQELNLNLKAPPKI